MLAYAFQSDGRSSSALLRRAEEGQCPYRQGDVPDQADAALPRSTPGQRNRPRSSTSRPTAAPPHRGAAVQQLRHGAQLSTHAPISATVFATSDSIFWPFAALISSRADFIATSICPVVMQLPRQPPSRHPATFRRLHEFVEFPRQCQPFGALLHALLRVWCSASGVGRFFQLRPTSGGPERRLA